MQLLEFDYIRCRNNHTALGTGINTGLVLAALTLMGDGQERLHMEEEIESEVLYICHKVMQVPKIN